MEAIESNSFWRSLVGNTCKELNAKVLSDLRKVDSIDQQILDLVESRNYILFGLNSQCLNVEVGKTCIGYPLLKVWKAYKDDGFNSRLVKEAVKDLRALFFDDSKDKFKKLYCVQILYHEYGCDSDDVHFIFEDDDGHSMKLTFNIKRYEEEHLYSYKLLNGYIYFGAKEGRDYSTIMRSMDPDVIRDSIEKWIDNGFKAKHYEFEHSTLQDKISAVFKAFSDMRIHNMYCRDENEEWCRLLQVDVESLG